MDAYFATLPVDTAEDGEYPRYVKWRNFWRDRVDFGDDKLRGNLNEANRLYSAALADGGNICVDNTSQDLYWKPLGEQRMETASMGLISDAYGNVSSSKHAVRGLLMIEDALGSRKVVALTGSRIYFSEDDGATFEPFHFNLGADPTQWTDYRFLDMELDSRAPDNPDY